MGNITEQIIFNNEYPKLHNAKSGILAAVITSIPAELLKTKWLFLTNYDTLRSDGKYYGIQKGIKYILLLFISDNGFLIPSIRKENEENLTKYADKVGSIFEFIIEENG